MFFSKKGDVAVSSFINQIRGRKCYSVLILDIAFPKMNKKVYTFAIIGGSFEVGIYFMFNLELNRFAELF